MYRYWYDPCGESWLVYSPHFVASILHCAMSKIMLLLRVLGIASLQLLNRSIHAIRHALTLISQ